MIASSCRKSLICGEVKFWEVVHIEKLHVHDVQRSSGRFGECLQIKDRKIKPVIGLENSPNNNWVKKYIYGYTHPHEYREWKKMNGTTSVVISFSDFIDYWLNSIGKMSQDTHFLPIFDICHPCHIQFNYYGNFNAFDEYADVLIKVIGNNDTSARHSYHTEMKKMLSMTPDYYSQLSTKQKEMIVDKLARDMSFYYTDFFQLRNVITKEPWVLVMIFLDFLKWWTSASQQQNFTTTLMYVIFDFSIFVLL